MIVLSAPFLLLGLGIPVLTYYLPQIINGQQRGVRISLPKQTALDALSGYASDIAQLGTLVVAIVAAASLAIDAQPSLAAFYRTRVRRLARLVLPRYLTVCAASAAALALGTAGAWYETSVIFGHVPAGAILAGLALESLWLCFVTSVTALLASVLRGVLGIVGATIALVLALGLLGNLSAVAPWLPTRLAASVAALAGHPAGDIWRAVVVTGVATPALLAVSLRAWARREPRAADASA
jgi:ABC-2 type transport system permease protein